MLRTVSTRANFQLQFRQFEHVPISGQLVWQVLDRTANKHSSHKHSFCTPRHIPYCIQTFILHTKVYHHGRVKFGVYKGQASSHICHSCIIFHILCCFCGLRCTTHRLYNANLTAGNMTATYALDFFLDSTFASITP